MKATGTILDKIVRRSELRLQSDKEATSLAEMKRRVADAPPVISFSKSLRKSFGVIAEIKKRSPSQGAMIQSDVPSIARQYQASSIVRAFSVLTNRDDFGMSIEDLAVVRKLTDKPILRKDFIFDEYQIYEARAHGADAVLLMTNVVTDREALHGLFHLSQDLGMDVLFECRSREEIAMVPEGATVFGINSRKMAASVIFGLSWRYLLGKFASRIGIGKDRSIQLKALELVTDLPQDAIKVAESGVDANSIALVRDKLRYDAVLIGTALLNRSQNVEHSLRELASALSQKKSRSDVRVEKRVAHA